jgi:hypothetical protein
LPVPAASLLAKCVFSQVMQCLEMVDNCNWLQVPVSQMLAVRSLLRQAARL